jgi:hypothetical protein
MQNAMGCFVFLPDSSDGPWTIDHAPSTIDHRHSRSLFTAQQTTT